MLLLKIKLECFKVSETATDRQTEGPATAEAADSFGFAMVTLQKKERKELFECFPRFFEMYLKISVFLQNVIKSLKKQRKDYGSFLGSQKLFFSLSFNLTAKCSFHG